MAKKQNGEREISDLLKKLYASFGKEAKESKSKPEEDAEDKALQDALRSTLASAEAEPPKKEKKEKKEKKQKRAKKEVPAKQTKPAPIPEPEPSQEPFSTFAEEPAEEALPEIKEELPMILEEAVPNKSEETLPEIFEKAPKKARKPRKKAEKANKKEPALAPSVEKNEITEAQELPPSVLEKSQEEEPAEQITKAPAFEESTAEELTTEKSLIEEPITEAPAAEEAIVSIPEEAPVPKAKESAPAKPIVIKLPDPAKKTVTQNTTLPKSAAVAPRKDPDSIVIRPAEVKTQTETIVIRPRMADVTTPLPRVKTEAIAAEPIRIGQKAADSPTKQTEVTKVATEKKTPEAEKKTPSLPQNTTKQAPAKKPAPSAKSSSRGAVSLPKSTAPATPKAQVPKAESAKPAAPAKKAAPAARATGKKTVRRVPVHLIPEVDDNLDEVLDIEEPLFEEIPVDAPEEVAPPKKTSIFSRRRKEAAHTPNMPVLELVKKKSGLSEDDIFMILELGYENELGRLVGFENVRRLKYEYVEKRKLADGSQYENAPGWRGEEYSHRAQTDTVRAALAHDRKFLILRMLASVVLVAVALISDMPILFGDMLANYDLAYPYLFPLAGLAAFLLSASLAYRQILGGWRALFRFAPTADSVISVAVLLISAYDILTLFLAPAEFRINLPATLILLLAAVCDILRLSAQWRIFRIISSEEEKTILEPSIPRKKKLRQGDKIVKIVNEDTGIPEYRIKRVKTPVGFFRRCNNFSSLTGPFIVFFVMMLSLSVLCGFGLSIVTENSSLTFVAVMKIILLTMPISAIFLYSYPLCRANRLLSKAGSALVGEESVSEYSEEKSLVFADEEMFSACKCINIAVQREDNFRTDLALINLLFLKLGGTLGKIAKESPPPTKILPVSVVRITAGGTEAMIDNRYHILIGNRKFMQQNGIRTPKESTDALASRPQNTAQMFAAIDGILKLSYDIEYTVDPKFEEMMQSLAEADTAVSIISYDPNLNNEFVNGLLDPHGEPVSVIKPGRWEEDKVLEIADSGVVTLGTAADTVYPIYAAHATHGLYRFGVRMQLISSLLGAVAVTALTIFDMAAWIDPLTIIGYQAFWLLVSYFASLFSLNKSTLKKQK